VEGARPPPAVVSEQAHLRAACCHRSPSRMDVEPIKDKPLDSSYASFPADDPVEAAKVPPPPTQDVPPKATGVALSLIKPASPFAKATQPLGGRPKPRPRTDPVAEKIKTLGRAPDETLHAVKP